MINEWLNDPYVVKWLSKKSPQTQKNYKAFYPNWLNFIQISPTEQIMKRVSDIQSGDFQQRTWFEDKVVEYKNLLQTQFDNELTIRAFLTCVRSFFSSNRLPLAFERKELNAEVENKVIKQSWVPSNIEVRVIYGQANVRDRALLLCLYQSGFSEVDVCELNIEDLPNIMETETHYYIEKKREKTNVVTATCLSAECVHDIKNMLRERGTPSSGALFLTPKVEKPTRLTVRFANEAIKKLVSKAYPNKDFKTRSLRSAYNSALLRANVQPQELKDLMMGHTREGARKHYAFDNITILEAYEKAFQYLSINGGLQSRKDLEKITGTVEQLASIIATQKLEMDTLKQQVTDTNNAFQIIQTFIETKYPETKELLKGKGRTLTNNEIGEEQNHKG